MKQCSKCGEAKCESEFFRRAEAPDGLRGACKACEKPRIQANNRRYAERHPERKAQSFANWYARNREAHCKSVRQYAEDNAERLRQKRHSDYWADPDRHRKKSRDHSAANRPKMNDRKRQWLKSGSASAEAYKARSNAESAKSMKKGRATLSDSYVKKVLRAGVLCAFPIPSELIACKRTQLKIERQLREKLK